MHHPWRGRGHCSAQPGVVNWGPHVSGPASTCFPGSGNNRQALSTETLDQVSLCMQLHSFASVYGSKQQAQYIFNAGKACLQTEVVRYSACRLLTEVVSLHTQLPAQPRIISVKLDRKGRRLLASCSDRVIRWAHVASPAAQKQPGSFSVEEAAARVRTPAKVTHPRSGVCNSALLWSRKRTAQSKSVAARHGMLDQCRTLPFATAITHILAAGDTAGSSLSMLLSSVSYRTLQNFVQLVTAVCGDYTARRKMEALSRQGCSH